MAFPAFTIFAFCLVLSPMARADQALAKANNCMGCHAVDKKVVGPSYRAVAARYASQDAVDRLAAKMVQGGGGTWGAVPMPANPRISPADARKLAVWVLSQK